VLFMFYFYYIMMECAIYFIYFTLFISCYMLNILYIYRVVQKKYY